MSTREEIQAAYDAAQAAGDFIGMWDAYSLTPDPVTNGGRPVPRATNGHSPYAAAALTKECDALAAMPSDTGRNDALNTAAYNMGQLVGAGHIDAATVRDALEQAARASGLPQHEIDTCLRDTDGGGMRAGAQSPRQVPDRPATPQPTVIATPSPEHVTLDEAPKRLRDGAAFILDAPDTVPTLWGDADDVLWARGEALMIVGPPGVGKTTLTGQILRARLGLGNGHVLGYPIETTASKVLYLAMDRPAQIARALRRSFTADERAHLSEHLMVWEGPPPADIAKRPEILPGLAALAGADTVIIDSLKDAAIGLGEDEVAAGYNRARQMCLTDGVEVLELHHLVKRGVGGAKPNTLADVYGSAWLTAGAGSVILLWGAAGDPIVALSHLKQPSGEVGPFRVIHDHQTGATTIFSGTDLLTLARNLGDYGLTAQGAAVALFGKEKPTASEIEKARRKLDKLAEKGLVTRIQGAFGGSEGTSPTTYRALTNPLTVLSPELSTLGVDDHSRNLHNPRSATHESTHATHALGPLTNVPPSIRGDVGGRPSDEDDNQPEEWWKK